MELRHPISSYTPLTEAELAKALELGTLLNNKWLPISRRGVDREERARAERNFAHALAGYLTLANLCCLEGRRCKRDFEHLRREMKPTDSNGRFRPPARGSRETSQRRRALGP